MSSLPRGMARDISLETMNGKGTVVRTLSRRRCRSPAEAAKPGLSKVPDHSRCSRLPSLPVANDFDVPAACGYPAVDQANPTSLGLPSRATEGQQ